MKTRKLFIFVWVGICCLFVILGILGSIYDSQFWCLTSSTNQHAKPILDPLFFPFAGHTWYAIVWRCWASSLMLFFILSLAEKRFFARSNLFRPLSTDVTALISWSFAVPLMMVLLNQIQLSFTDAADVSHKFGVFLPAEQEYREFRTRLEESFSVTSTSFLLRFFIVTLVVIPFAIWYQRANAKALGQKGYWTLIGRWPSFAGTVLFVWIIYGGLLVGSLITDWLTYWHLVSATTELPGRVAIRPTHPDESGGLGSFWNLALLMDAFGLAYGLLVGFLIGVRYYRANLPLFSAQNIAKLVAYILLMIVLLAPPLRMLHSRLKSFKDDVETKVSEQVDAEMVHLSASCPTSMPTNVAILKEVRNHTSSWPTWPGGVVGIPSVLLSGAGPLLPMAMSFLSKRFQKRRKYSDLWESYG